MNAVERLQEIKEMLASVDKHMAGNPGSAVTGVFVTENRIVVEIEHKTGNQTNVTQFKVNL